MTAKGQHPTLRKNTTNGILSERQKLRILAGKIKKIPLEFADEDGYLSEAKILAKLIDYHRGHSSD